MTQERIAILHYSSPPIVGGVEFIIEAHSGLFAERGYPTKLIVGEGEKTSKDVAVDGDGAPLNLERDALSQGPREVADQSGKGHRAFAERSHATAQHFVVQCRRSAFGLPERRFQPAGVFLQQLLPAVV